MMVREPLGPRWRWLRASAIGFALANALWSAWDQGWTYDEPFHLQWSARLLESGETERDSQERYNSKTPLTVVNVWAQKAASALGAADPRVLRFAARLPSVAWLAALLAATSWTARRWFGPSAATLALLGAALEPNLVAHASLVTVDLAFALATLLVLAAGLACAERPSAARGALLGLALGFAVTAKFSALLLLPGLAVLPLVVRGSGTARSRAAAIAAALATAWLSVSAAYLFLGMAVPLSASTWRSARLAALARATPGLALPVPAAFLTGLDRSLSTERGEWNVLILGRRYPHGIWYYFALLWLLKTPVGLLVAEAVGLVRAARDRVLRASPAARLLAWNLGLTLVYFSLFFHAQIGFRFVLMAIPLALILAAAGLARIEPTPRLRAAGLALVLLAAAEDAPYFGDPLAFTNLALQPKRDVYRWIADSNVDWGQNRERIERWLTEANASTSALDPIHVVPGHNTIDLNLLAGLWDEDRFRWVREHLTPAGRLGYTYLWYDIDYDAFDRFLDDTRRLVPSAAVAQVCGESSGGSRVEGGQRVPFTLDHNPAENEGFAVCLENRKTIDLALKVREGRVQFGPFRTADACDDDLVGSGQSSWYRLEPGRHALCAMPVPNRRAYLPYVLDAALQVRGHAALLALRPVTLRAPTPPAPAATSPRSSSPPRPPGG